MAIRSEYLAAQHRHQQAEQAKNRTISELTRAEQNLAQAREKLTQKAERLWNEHHRGGITDKIDHMTGSEFEEFLVRLLERLEHANIQLTDINDLGGDITSETPHGSRLVIQAKRWKQSVGISAVQEVLGGMVYYGCDEGWVVTNSEFTESARALAEKDKRIQLHGRKWLLDRVREHFPTEPPPFDWGSFSSIEQLQSRCARERAQVRTAQNAMDLSRATHQAACSELDEAELALDQLAQRREEAQHEMIHIECPSCRRELRGAVAQSEPFACCPGCSSIIRIEQASEEVALVEPQAPVAPKPLRPILIEPTFFQKAWPWIPWIVTVAVGCLIGCRLLVAVLGTRGVEEMPARSGQDVAAISVDVRGLTDVLEGDDEGADDAADALGRIGPAADFVNSIGVKMVLIPPDEFMMGSGDSAYQVARAFAKYGATSGRYLHEHPRHAVRITRPFYLGAYEVTVREFRRFVDDTGYKTDAERDGKGGYGYDFRTNTFGMSPRYSWRDSGFQQTDSQPAVNVSWSDTVAFCRWLSRKEAKEYRLPSEAEWEYACRGGTATRYWFGDAPELLVQVDNIADATAREILPRSKALSAEDGYIFTAPVGVYRPNPFGLYNMHGNVSEWCADWYDADYYERSPPDDPIGPTSGLYRVLRGGSCYYAPDYARSANRLRGSQDYRNYCTGFRIAWTLP